jgi:beta-glucosidase
VAATGTPVVLVLVAGRPIGSPAAHQTAAAVLAAWKPGECGGGAIADALTGTTSPGGRLPISYPRSSGQVPIFYAHKVSGGRSHWKGPYVDLSNEPLYPFGYGLTYSTFELTAHPLAEADLRVASGEVVEIAVSVTNTGDRRADEVVQLYATDRVASITQPVRQLRGFARVTLDPEAAADIVFHLAVDALGFTGPDLVHIVEPGTIELAVGPSSADLVPVAELEIVGPVTSPASPVFTTPVTVRHRV